MGKTLVEMTAELVQAQCASTSMSPEELKNSLKETYKVLHELQDVEARSAASEAGVAAVGGNPLKSIQRHKIVCLECGQEFRTLSYKHLASHSLTGKEYRKKWGIPMRQALSAKEISDRRKDQGKKRGVPENLRKYTASRKGTGKNSAPAASADKAAKTTRAVGRPPSPRKTTARKTTIRKPKKTDSSEK